VTWRQLAALLDPRRLVFIDESGSHIGMVRTHAWAPVGERAHGQALRNRGNATTMIGAIALDGIRSMMTIEGPTTAEVFDAFVELMLVPALKPGDVVVLDNVGAHKPTRILQRIMDAGASFLFLPPYSPDLNPIEMMWSKLKGLLRSAGALTRDTLDAAIAAAMERVTLSDLLGWFTHCGYRAQAA
jgi:transposase